MSVGASVVGLGHFRRIANSIASTASIVKGVRQAEPMTNFVHQCITFIHPSEISSGGRFRLNDDIVVCAAFDVTCGTRVVGIAQVSISLCGVDVESPSKVTRVEWVILSQTALVSTFWIVVEPVVIVDAIEANKLELEKVGSIGGEGLIEYVDAIIDHLIAHVPCVSTMDIVPVHRNDPFGLLKIASSTILFPTTDNFVRGESLFFTQTIRTTHV